MDEFSPFLVNSNGNGSKPSNDHFDMSPFNNQHNNAALLGGSQLRYRRSSFTPLFDRDDSGVYEDASEKYINDPIHHSIGTSHLAGELVERFRDTQPELGISASDVKCLKLAGLCHDLGHGPFSHVFDNEFIPQAIPGSNWTHEQGSEMMLEYLVDDNHVDIDREEINFIKDLIMGERRGNSQRHAFLFDIVSNKRNSLDVDKYDYLQRDCYNVGIKSSIDCSRLMKMSRVIDDQICWHHKEVYNLYELYHTRFSLFKRVYTHRVGKAIEYMLTDALLAADSVMGISQAIFDGEQYLHLTDDIIRQIERSHEPGLEDSKAILKRIRTRNLYKFVDELLIPREKLGVLTKENINSTEIVSCQGSNDHLRRDDVIVEFLKNNYAMKDQNPVDGIKFFSKTNHSASYHIPKEKVSSLIPSEFQENIIRVFSRDPTKVQAVHEAFRRLMSRFYRGSDGSSNLPPSSTSPYYNSRNTTPERTNAYAMSWMQQQNRQSSPTRSLGVGGSGSGSGSSLGNAKKRRERSPSPLSGQRVLSSGGLKSLGDGVMDISDNE
ncbi:SAM domain and HD [Mortierella sp. NVP41]|nr:SAM domain and HD [Mortierella sp. NVP41]